MDSAGSDRPQRRTALVGRELGRYDIQIAALSETRFADVGEIKEVGAGYTFFWSGRKSEERREAGVGFAIKTELVGKLSGLPKGINDRLMTLKGTSRQRSGKGAIRKRFPLQKPRWEKTKPTARYLYHETYRKPNEQLFSQ